MEGYTGPYLELVYQHTTFKTEQSRCQQTVTTSTNSKVCDMMVDYFILSKMRVTSNPYVTNWATLGAFMSLGIMEKTFSRRAKVLVNDTSWRSCDSTSVRQLGPDLVNRVVQLVTYGLLVTRRAWTWAEHRFYSIWNWSNWVLFSSDYFLLDKKNPAVKNLMRSQIPNQAATF